MRCYYEELCISRDSNDADIKSAYRKLALRWHPDKNPECLAEAKERFQLIQQAYEILSDAHERAWYDSHRDQILRGKNSEYEENSLDLFQYFTVSCYKGYDDEPNSFYNVYRDVFSKLAVEDMEFMDESTDIGDIPNFGKVDSNYEEVVGPFYAYWQAYSTKKTYEWLCPYDILEIKDRYVLRKVEKEMKKIVQKARKERNEEVRNLVSFIRKRDRRVLAYRRVLEERAELNRQKQEDKRKEQLRKRQEELTAVRQENKALNESYEQQLKLLEQEYEGNSECYDFDEEDNSKTNSDGSEDVENIIDDLYCVACNKSFKNSNAFVNHEESKKHRENVERLRSEMVEEEETYIKSPEANKECATDSDCLEDTEEALNELHLDTAESNDCEEENISIAQNKRNKRKKIKKFSVIEDSPASEPSHDDDTTQLNTNDSSNADDWSCNNNKKSAKKNKNKKTKSCKIVPEIEESAEPKPILSNINGASTSDIGPEVLPHMCVTCKSSFDSKNKLFAHLKKTNHGVYIPKPIPIVEGKRNKAKGKRK